MGSVVRLRDRDLAFARSRRFLNPELERKWSDRELHDYCRRRLLSMGYRFVHKVGPSSWKLKRFTTTLRRVIYLGVGWSSKSWRAKAATLAHELVHALQWKSLRAFGVRYVFDERFRFAVECQAYRETVRAFRAMGLHEQAVQDYADGVPDDFVKGYAITDRGLRNDIRNAMTDVILTP